MEISSKDRITRLEYMAEHGSAKACKRLSVYYFYCIYVEWDSEKALYYSAKACELAPDDMESKRLHAKIYTYVHWDEYCDTDMRSQEELEWLFKFAEHYNSNAAMAIATSYCYGIHLERNMNLANQWLYKAASLGNEKAKRRLALRYRYGLNVEHNNKEDAVLCEQACFLSADKGVYFDTLYYLEEFANKNACWAINNIGYLLNAGSGIVRDPGKGFAWYLVSATNGNISARNVLANEALRQRNLYFSPWLILKYLNAGENTGNALREIGFMEAGLKMPAAMSKQRELQRSKGSKPDMDQLDKIYRELAITGYPDALCALAAVTQNEFMKIQLLKMAAMLGHSYALFELGNYYQKYNKEVAECCYREAASRGHKLAAVYVG